MKVLVTGVAGQLGHDVMNELADRNYEGIGSDIATQYSGIMDETAVTKMPYIQLDITDKESVRNVISKEKPDVVVVVDALAARSTKRLNRTIQITNTGIHPGSGVGNHRNAITQEALGVPVIAIGVPTVVDAATIVSDAFEKMMRQAGEEPIDIQDELMAGLGELYSMYVTGKDVDYEIKQISHIICNALNCALEV